MDQWHHRRSKWFGENKALLNNVVKRVGCIYCGAEPGEFCLNNTRERLPHYIHAKRWRDYKLQFDAPLIMDEGGGP